jgi:uncharacterized protein (TIGR00297 family)
MVPAGFAVMAYALGMVSRGGALGGFGIAAPIYLSLGWRGFAVLALFVVGGSVLTKIGYKRKDISGTAESGGGRRGARNALANGGVAVLCSLLAALTSYPEIFAAAFVASLGAAFADTAESEVGQLYGGTPRLITTLAKAPPGTDGAVSWPGTLAGIVAAGLTAALGFALGLIWSPGGVLVVGFAAFLGTVVDSLVGALAPRVGNEATNVVCTLTAAALILLLL